jgi:hypothetical protein
MGTNSDNPVLVILDFMREQTRMKSPNNLIAVKISTSFADRICDMSLRDWEEAGDMRPDGAPSPQELYQSFKVRGHDAIGSVTFGCGIKLSINPDINAQALEAVFQTSE